MKYFVAVLLALAVYVEVSNAVCKQHVTVSQDFTALCASFTSALNTYINLPEPTRSGKGISCYQGEFTVFNCQNQGFNVIEGRCVREDEDSQGNCVNPGEICGEGDKKVPYAPKGKRFASRYFADCTNYPPNFEVGICFSDQGEKCEFDPSTSDCKVV